ADDCRTGRQIEIERQKTSQRRYYRTHGPPNSQAWPDILRVEHRSDRWHDEVAEYQQHTRDRHRRGHHETERRVEEEIPEADRNALRFGFLMIHGDGEEFFAKNKVEQPDGAVKRGGLYHLVPGDRKNVAHQHLLQMLGLFG